MARGLLRGKISYSGVAMQMRSAIVKISVIGAVAVGSFFVFMKPAASGSPVAVIDDGGQIYGTKCAGCHGADGKGNERLKGRVPDFTNADWQKKHSDDEFTQIIKEGKRPMPPFKDKLSDDEIKAVIGKVRSFASK